MPDLITLICAFVVDLFRSRAALEAEVLVLRQQIVVLRRGKPTRPPMGAIDRLLLGWVCWLFRPRVTRWPWFGRRRCYAGTEPGSVRTGAGNPGADRAARRFRQRSES
jgi:hypothetical protein